MFPARGNLAFLALALIVSVAAPRSSVLADPKEERGKRPANRLEKETSPYLLLHAHNPVDWYPWGPEAFAKAKAANKPIFLSVGYSSCYWCHVMERESFENIEIAKLLNAQFVCVKVDREERPDVDQVYMAALRVFGNGGWPMSLFLTADGRPFFGGTYFPPADRDGAEGFPTLLKRVADAWRDQRPALERDAERLSQVVRRSLDAQALRPRAPLSRAMAQAGREALAEQFDPEYGGFGFDPQNARRPKFPEPVNLVFLLDQHRRAKSSKDKSPGVADPLTMVVTTMDRMARGGIRDQLAGGYHRYATSRYWIVPHFEKMLYDNAQLASAHLLVFELSGDARWRAEAEATFAFVADTMTAPEGGFYSAIDAETDGEEGAYYVWSRDEVKKLLGETPEHDAFSRVYGLKRDPNFEKNRYVLLEPRTRAEQAETLATTPDVLEARLAPARAKLRAARDRRPTPLRDDKILTSWNGLMIAAYADAYRLLKTPAYRETAEKAADFVLTKLRDKDGRLLRTYRVGQAKLPGYLEDYAFLAHGLLRLHAATGESKRLDQARVLTDRMLDDFEDPKAGGFFYTADDHESLIARTKDPNDNVLPSGNSVAVRNLIALAKLTKEPRYLDAAGKALDAFSSSLAQSPGMLPLMLVGLEEYLDARPAAAPVAIAAPVTDDRGSASVVTVEATSEPVKAGLEVDLSIHIKDGWHLYASGTAAQANVEFIPTRVRLESSQGWQVASIDYPPGEAKAVGPDAREKVAVYEGAIRLRIKLSRDPAFDGEPAAPKLRLDFQACDERSCLAPDKLIVTPRPRANHP
jgi:uncharacterized protein